MACPRAGLSLEPGRRLAVAVSDHCRVQGRAVVIGLVLIVSGLSSLTGPSDASRAAVATALGVYRGPAPERVAEFGAWLGKSPKMALDYVDSSSWSTIADPTWAASAWSKSPYRVVYSVPIIPDSGGTLKEGAAGSYNVHFRRLAETLVRLGQGNAVLRLGWEFNGEWMRWSTKYGPGLYAAYWRQIVHTMRSVAGARFEFDWCVSIGHSEGVEAAYPGDGFVDYIGMDAYDTWWNEAERVDVARRWQGMVEQPGGLRWHRDFARAHGKPMTYPEWGLWIRPDGHGGGDNPYYIERMGEWISRNNVAYHMYFEVDAPDGEHRLMTGRFPRGAAAFRASFAQSSATGDPPSGSSRRPAGADTQSSPRRLWRGDRAWSEIRTRR
jgi:Glycosyl hydrolase family 26